MRLGMRAGAALAVLALVAGCSSAPQATSQGARQDELVRAAVAVGPVTPTWTAVETSPICDGYPACDDAGVTFVSRRDGGSPQAVCAEAVPWVARAFGATYSVQDCVRAMTGPADPTTTLPGFTWSVLVAAREVAGATATWQVTVSADDVDWGSAGSEAAPVPLSYQAGGYLYDGDRVELIARFTGRTASPS